MRISSAKVVAAALAVVLLVVFPACDPGSWWKRHFGPRPNVLLLSVDALRADRIGCYGYKIAATPAMDKLAEEGVLFEEVIAAATWTQPSVAAMLTGRWPADLSASQSGDTTQSLHEDETTLAEVFKNAGYATASFTDNGTLSPDFGYGQGFNHVKNVIADDGEAITMPAIQWLGEHKEEPFFLWIHWLDPHEPYIFRGYKPYAPEDDPSRQVREEMELPFYFNDNVQNQLDSHYDNEVSFSDMCIQMVLDELERLNLKDNTLIVFTSDHGEFLGEFIEGGNRFGHGDPPYEEQIRIPLIFSWPKVLGQGSRVQGQRSNVDIFPTICKLARLKTLHNVSGKNLSKALLNGNQPANPWTYSQSFQKPDDPTLSMRFAIRTPESKLFMRANTLVSEQFRRDPATGNYELAGSLGVSKEEEKDLTDRLKEYVLRWASGPSNPSDDLKRRLEELGYIDN